MLKLNSYYFGDGVYMQKDSFGYNMTLLNSIFLFIMSLANYNILDLSSSRSIFWYTIPMALCTTVTNIILWRSLRGGKNEKDKFIKFLKIAIFIVFVLVIVVLGGAILYVIDLIDLAPASESDPTLCFCGSTSGNLASAFNALAFKIPAKWYALIQPTIYFFHIAISIMELVHYKLTHKKTDD